MSGSIPFKIVSQGIKAGRARDKKASGKPDLSVSEKKVTGPDDGFGVTALGRSAAQTDENSVSTVGSVPFRRKKPTITLLGDQP
jgi:hypothetical protein